MPRENRRCQGFHADAAARPSALPTPVTTFAWLLLFAALLASLAACGSPTPADPAARGKQLAADYGCAGCHSVTGGMAVGPTWKGLYGSQVDLADGRTVTVDDAYLTGRIANPGAVTVAGYPGGTMTAALQPHRAELDKPENVEATIAYIKTLK